MTRTDGILKESLKQSPSGVFFSTCISLYSYFICVMHSACYYQNELTLWYLSLLQLFPFHFLRNAIETILQHVCYLFTIFLLF